LIYLYTKFIYNFLFFPLSLFLSYTKSFSVHKGCILGPLFINVYINTVCHSDCNSSCVLLAEDFKCFHNIYHVKDCKLLQFDFDTVQKHFGDNEGKLNVDKTTFISLLSKQTVCT